MNKDKGEKYDKKCYVMQNLIYLHYQNDSFDFIRNPDTEYIEVIINGRSNLTLLYCHKWSEIKRAIDMRTTGSINKSCEICCNSARMVAICTKCSNTYCIDCYIDLFKAGNGIITCPYCRYSIGSNKPECMMELCIGQIKINAGICE
jgi:hypothetical protein